MSPPPLPSSNTLPLTPPFSPVTTTANDQQNPFHPLSRVETLELDAQPRLQEEYNTDEEDPTDSEDEDDDDDEMLPASFTNNNKFMDGEGEGIGGWKEKGTGGKGKLRVVIVTENFLPKVDGVTRTLARLLEHLHNEGHEALLCGPETGMSHYASHPLVGTLGIPLVVYPGLKLNFLRPKFMREIEEFHPDVIHMVDPIWLGGQTLMGLELGWAGEQWVGEKGPGVGGGLRGAVVASYHTNLATYATLFGFPWFEPIMWVWQRWLYSKCLLYLCPSQSTIDMLGSHSLPNARIWSRGVDLTHFNPGRRSATMRRSWGIVEDAGVVGESREQEKSVLGGGGLITPPTSPELMPLGAGASVAVEELGRTAVLYVGRISWEKNLLLLLHAHSHLTSLLPPSTPLPKLVFVGDGPARQDLETFCHDKGIDATFMGHRTGEDLAECYASADLFAFPSFTETFGQVVLEALASGLPVIGLDAEGTRDLVSTGSTGLLLPLPLGAKDWPAALKNVKSATFTRAAEDYAVLLARLISPTGSGERREMSDRAAKGTKGRTWHEAMEMCVSGYREAITLSQTRAALLRRNAFERQQQQLQSSVLLSDDNGRPIRAKVGRVLGRLRRGRISPDQQALHLGGGKERSEAVGGEGENGRTGRERETIWKLKSLAKILIVLYLLYVFYSRVSPLTSSSPSRTAIPTATLTSA
ncbi:hypothetical protein BDY24DRAFT_389910 [Mrakia frigida]|uniref:glycosyltransferase family 4 protein n=1 Tax=Mrakia frigida TaxID=29902 RepID=UPI003FCBFE65